MKILLTGATGFLGRAIAKRLAAGGHTLVALARDPVRAQAALPRLERAFAWRADGPPAEAFAGVEAIVNLAGETVAGRWTAAKMRAIRESRVGGTRALVDRLGALAERPRVLISASATGYYGNRGEETLADDASPGTGFLAEVCRDWEAEATRAAELGLRVVRLRFGLVLGPGGGALGPMLPLYRAGLGGPLGSGCQWWPWVSLEDVLGLVTRVLARDLAGAVNAVAPEAVRQRDFARALGRTLRRPAFLPAPAWALRIGLGRFAPELLASQRATPRVALASGYGFVHAELADALTAALDVPRSGAA
jgi:hypothetical protein